MNCFRLGAVLAIWIFVPMANGSEISVILGSPDPSVTSVQAMVQDRVEVGTSPYDVDNTTQLFSVIAARGVTHAAAIEVIGENGSVSSQDFFRAVREAMVRSKVVYTTFGGTFDANDEICKILSEYVHTAFVLAGGKSQNIPNNGSEPNCSSSNILRVGALGPDHAHLRPESNFGPTLRVASTGTDVPTIGPGNRGGSLSGTSVAAAFTAADLAVFAKGRPGLFGSGLIERFLEERTVKLLGLEGKIVGARAHF